MPARSKQTHSDNSMLLSEKDVKGVIVVKNPIILPEQVASVD